MDQGTPGTIRRCSGNNKQGQSREALTYKKNPGYLQTQMLTKHFAAGSLLGRSGIGAHGQRDPFSGTDGDFTDDSDHHVTIRRRQAS